MSLLDAGRYLGKPTMRIDTSRAAVIESSYHSGTHLQSHAHARAHFCVVLEGGYIERFGTADVERRSGCVSFLPAGAAHAEHHLTHGRHLMIDVAPSAVDDVSTVARVPTAPTTLTRRSALRLSSRLAREIRRPDPLTPLIVDSIVTELLGELCRERNRDAGPGDWIDAVRSRLDATPLHHHSLAALAREVGRHPMHVARAFRQRTGRSVGGYLRQRRVDWAATQIKSSELPISDIAVAAGFSDQSHFSRWCRTYLGVTPTLLRRR